jgi:multiple sugar transport system substrate-binding protein/putative aldouronate transport system substrate-binding protein
MPASGVYTCLVSKKATADTAAAIIMMYNILTRDEAIFDTSVAIEWYPLRTILAASDECEHTYRELARVLKGETKPEDYNDPMSPYKLLYGDVQEVRSVIPGYNPNRELNINDFNQSDRGNFNRMYSLMIGNRPFATQKVDKPVYSVTYAMTDLLEQRWANLIRMENEVMMRIIIGQLPISVFDRFVNDWLSQGGQAILEDLAVQFLSKSR